MKTHIRERNNNLSRTMIQTQNKRKFLTIYKDYEEKRDPVQEKQDFNDTVVDESEIMIAPGSRNKAVVQLYDKDTFSGKISD